MEILDVKDMDDGSCIMDCSFTNQEVDFFLNYAVVDILKEEIKKHERSWEYVKSVIRKVLN